MRQDFNKLLVKLKVDELAAVSIINLDNSAIILKPTYGFELKQNYGSVENYFEDLKQNGITNLLIQEYRKNGTGIKKVGNSFSVSFSEKHQSQPNNNGNHNFGMNGIPGLGFTDQVNLFADQRDKVRLEIENESLKREIEEVKKQRDDYKEQILQDKYDANKKSNNAELVKDIISAASPLLGAFIPQNTTGLSAPAQQQQNLSPLKQQLVNYITSNTVNDDYVAFVLNVISSVNNDGTYDQIEAIINPQNPLEDATE